MCSLLVKLFAERNKLVHSKSEEFVGMTEEQYQKFVEFLETDENANEWLVAETLRLDISNEKELLKSAESAMYALKEVAGFIDEHDDSEYAMTKLLHSGWSVNSQSEKYKKIKSAQIHLGVEPILFFDEELIF